MPPQPVNTKSIAMVCPSESEELVTASGLSFFGLSEALTDTVSKLEADAGIQTSRGLMVYEGLRLGSLISGECARLPLQCAPGGMAT